MEKEEHLIVHLPAPAGAPGLFLSDSMGQDEPVDATGGTLTISTQTIEEDPPQEHPDALDSDVASSSMKDTPEMKEIPEMARCTDLFSEEPQAPVPIPGASPDTNQPLVSDKYSAQNREPVGSPAGEQQEPPAPKGAYTLDLDQIDESFNPFASGGSKLPNSPPPCGSSRLPALEPLHEPLLTPDLSSAAAAEEQIKEPSSDPRSVMLEFGRHEGPVSEPPPRKLGGKKTDSKPAAKQQKAKAPEALAKAPTEGPETVPQPASHPLPEPAVPQTDSPAPLNLDDVPIPKTGACNFDPSKWDDPDFNPFGSNGRAPSLPAPPTGPYALHPDKVRDSLDPFKPPESLSTEESSSAAAPVEKNAPDRGQQKAERHKVRQSPRKSKERALT